MSTSRRADRAAKKIVHTATLRKVGGSMMLSVPPALIDVLHLRPGAKLGLSAEGNRLVAELLRRPRYTLDQLIAEHDSKAPRSKEDREWLESPPLGAELI